MTHEEIQLLLDVLKKGLDGNIIDRITITIKPKGKSESK